LKNGKRRAYFSSQTYPFVDVQPSIAIEGVPNCTSIVFKWQQSEVGISNRIKRVPA
jgi:hypothetical protein